VKWRQWAAKRGKARFLAVFKRGKAHLLEKWRATKKQELNAINVAKRQTANLESMTYGRCDGDTSANRFELGATGAGVARNFLYWSRCT